MPDFNNENLYEEIPENYQQNPDPGLSQRALSNKIAKRIIKDKNSQKKAFKTGAMIGALRNEGLSGAAGRGWIWFLFSMVGITSIFTLGFSGLLILIYLNFHYWKSKKAEHSRWFVPMSFFQKITLFFLDIIFIFLFIIIILIFYIIIYCSTHWIKCGWKIVS